MKDYRTLGIAIVISLFLHLIVGYSLAAFGSAFTPALPVEDKPVELTIVDTSTPPPLVPKNPPYMETDPSKETVEKPKEQTFESNANSIAASEVPATSDLPLPSQEGKERPNINLETHDYSIPTDGSKPQPEVESATAQQPPRPPIPKQKTTVAESTPKTVSVPTPRRDEFALLKMTPPPAMKAPEETTPSPPITTEMAPPVSSQPKPNRPSSSYQAQKQQTRITGGLNNRGPSSVNAVGTPLGRYQKALSDAIGSRWYYYVDRKRDLISIGTVVIHAEVDADGKVKELQVRSNTANETCANICLQSFQEAHIPPIPPDLIGTLPEGRFPVDYTFTFYAN